MYRMALAIGGDKCRVAGGRYMRMCLCICGVSSAHDRLSEHAYSDFGATSPTHEEKLPLSRSSILMMMIKTMRLMIQGLKRMFWDVLGAILGPLGGHFWAFGGFPGPLWAHWVSYLELWGHKNGFPRSVSEILERFWSSRGTFWLPIWGYFDRCQEPLKFESILGRIWDSFLAILGPRIDPSLIMNELALHSRFRTPCCQDLG